MSDSHGKSSVKFEKPGRYRIVVEGNINESWSDRLAGMRIVSNHREKGKVMTTLTGDLRDQTQLSGVLNTLYELHLSILLVEYLKEDYGV